MFTMYPDNKCNFMKRLLMLENRCLQKKKINKQFVSLWKWTQIIKQMQLYSPSERQLALLCAYKAVLRTTSLVVCDRYVISWL